MRLNRYIALATGLSRRVADRAIADGRVRVNKIMAVTGQQIQPSDEVTLDNRPITTAVKSVTIILHKPAGYVCSRRGQGSKTIYDLLPPELHYLKPVGRLDKDSSGLLLLTNDGLLANQLTHPSFSKEKVYEVEIDRPLTQQDFDLIVRTGVDIGDAKLSQFRLQELATSKQKLATGGALIPHSYFLVTMREGRNRQIRRTFAALDYNVTKLHRTQFGEYKLSSLQSGKYKTL